MKLHVVEIEKGHPGLKKDTPGLFTKDEIEMVANRFNNHEKLEEALAWLLEEYHFLSRKMTEINNIVQPLWGELRERRNDYQLIEDLIEQIKEKGLEQALKEAEKPK